MAARPTADTQAVFTGQHEVENHQVRLAVDDPSHGAATIALDCDIEAVGLEVFGGELGQTLVVFDDKDARCGLVHGLCLCNCCCSVADTTCRPGYCQPASGAAQATGLNRFLW
ncbi:hypothetical protein D3C79_840570 [compost metagenome]